MSKTNHSDHLMCFITKTQSGHGQFPGLPRLLYGPQMFPWKSLEIAGRVFLFSYSKNPRTEKRVTNTKFTYMTHTFPVSQTSNRLPINQGRKIALKKPTFFNFKN